jgi:hypothetical protein
MTASTEILYSAGQAAHICGLSPTDLQIALDREYVKATVVPMGARTYRKFTRDQLLSLWIFTLMTDDHIKPSMASAYVEILENLLPQLGYVNPIEYVIFGEGFAATVEKGKPATEFKKALHGGHWVLPYEDTCNSLDTQLQYISHMDRIIEATDQS